MNITPTFKRIALSATAITTIALSQTLAFSQERPTGPGPKVVDVITVTASKRAESVQKIPYNITAETGETLEKLGVVDLTKLARIVPGISTIDRGPRENTRVVIRGLSVDRSSPSGNSNGNTVSAYINDTAINLDFKLLDLNRVEVLRGPQGTLYGAGSLGGTIRYITNKPNTEETTIEAHANTYVTKESSGFSYDTDTVVNIPLVEDKIAFRGVFGYVDEKGFIDYNHVLINPEDSLLTKSFEDLNFEKTVSARASLLWNINEDIEAIASYYYQSTETGGRQVANEVFTGNRYVSPSRYVEPNERKSQLFNFDLTWDLGFAEFFSTTSYQKFGDLGQRDQTDLLLNLDIGYDSIPFFSGFTEEINDDKAFTQEIRLVSQDEGPIEWLVGAFYTQEENFGTSQEFAPGTPEFFGIFRPDNLEYFSWDAEEIREYAFFGELTYNITDDLSITGGIRHQNLKEELESCLAFPLYPGTPGTNVDFACSGAGVITGNPYPTADGTPAPNERSYIDAGNPFDTIKNTFYKANIEYNVNDDLLLYGTFSQGFRRGGSNAIPSGGQVGVLPARFLRFNPDTVDNFELGFKSQWMDNRVTFNANVFLINWKDIQLSTSTGAAFGSVPVTVNGDAARSTGVELEVKALITDDFRMNLAYSYTNAKLTADAPQVTSFLSDNVTEVGSLDGDRVPLVPKHKLYLGFDYFMALSNGSGELNFHVDGSITDSMPSTLRPNARDYELIPGYEILNASISYLRDDWSLTLYANNLTNNYATFGGRFAANSVIAGQQGAWNFVNRPRTVGLDLRTKF